jgi:hypothetical protein
MLRIYADRINRDGMQGKPVDFTSRDSTRVRVYSNAEDSERVVELEVHANGGYWLLESANGGEFEEVMAGRIGSGMKLPKAVVSMLDDAFRAANHARDNRGGHVLVGRAEAMVDVVAAWTGRHSESVSQEFRERVQSEG